MPVPVVKDTVVLVLISAGQAFKGCGVVGEASGGGQGLPEAICVSNTNSPWVTIDCDRSQLQISSHISPTD